MANVAIHPEYIGFWNKLARAFMTGFNALGDFFAAIGDAHSRQNALEHMNNLTDRELADRYGINRDQIVAYVFPINFIFEHRA